MTLNKGHSEIISSGSFLNSDPWPCQFSNQIDAAGWGQWL